MKYQEIIATPSSAEQQESFIKSIVLRRENSRYLMMVRENEIEAGLADHRTPSMKESERKLREAASRDS